MAKNVIFGPRMVKIAMSKSFGRKFSLVGIDQNISKSILNQKSRNRKFFPVQILFQRLSHFLAEIVENGKVKKCWSNFFVGIDQECF